MTEKEMTRDSKEILNEQQVSISATATSASGSASTDTKTAEGVDNSTAVSTRIASTADNAKTAPLSDAHALDGTSALSGGTITTSSSSRMSDKGASSGPNADSAAISQCSRSQNLSVCYIADNHNFTTTQGDVRIIESHNSGFSFSEIGEIGRTSITDAFKGKDIDRVLTQLMQFSDLGRLDGALLSSLRERLLDVTKLSRTFYSIFPSYLDQVPNYFSTFMMFFRNAAGRQPDGPDRVRLGNLLTLVSLSSMAAFLDKSASGAVDGGANVGEAMEISFSKLNSFINDTSRDGVIARVYDIIVMRLQQQYSSSDVNLQRVISRFLEQLGFTGTVDWDSFKTMLVNWVDAALVIVENNILSVPSRSGALFWFASALAGLINAFIVRDGEHFYTNSLLFDDLALDIKNFNANSDAMQHYSILKILYDKTAHLRLNQSDSVTSTVNSTLTSRTLLLIDATGRERKIAYVGASPDTPVSRDIFAYTEDTQMAASMYRAWSMQSLLSQALSDPSSIRQRIIEYYANPSNIQSLLYDCAEAIGNLQISDKREAISVVQRTLKALMTQHQSLALLLPVVLRYGGVQLKSYKLLLDMVDKGYLALDPDSVPSLLKQNEFVTTVNSVSLSWDPGVNLSRSITTVELAPIFLKKIMKLVTCQFSNNVDFDFSGVKDADKRLAVLAENFKTLNDSMIGGFDGFSNPHYKNSTEYTYLCGSVSIVASLAAAELLGVQTGLHSWFQDNIIKPLWITLMTAHLNKNNLTGVQTLLSSYPNIFLDYYFTVGSEQHAQAIVTDLSMQVSGLAILSELTRCAALLRIIKICQFITNLKIEKPVSDYFEVVINTTVSYIDAIAVADSLNRSNDFFSEINAVLSQLDKVSAAMAFSIPDDIISCGDPSRSRSCWRSYMGYEDDDLDALGVAFKVADIFRLGQEQLNRRFSAEVAKIHATRVHPLVSLTQTDFTATTVPFGESDASVESASILSDNESVSRSLFNYYKLKHKHADGSISINCRIPMLWFRDGLSEVEAAYAWHFVNDFDVPDSGASVSGESRLSLAGCQSAEILNDEQFIDYIRNTISKGLVDDKPSSGSGRSKASGGSKVSVSIPACMRSGTAAHSLYSATRSLFNEVMNETSRSKQEIVSCQVARDNYALVNGPFFLQSLLSLLRLFPTYRAVGARGHEGIFGTSLTFDGLDLSSLWRGYNERQVHAFMFENQLDALLSLVGLDGNRCISVTDYLQLREWYAEHTKYSTGYIHPDDIVAGHSLEVIEVPTSTLESWFDTGLVALKDILKIRTNIDSARGIYLVPLIENNLIDTLSQRWFVIRTKYHLCIDDALTTYGPSLGKSLYREFISLPKTSIDLADTLSLGHALVAGTKQLRESISTVVRFVWQSSVISHFTPIRHHLLFDRFDVSYSDATWRI